LTARGTVYLSGPACFPEELESLHSIAALLETSGFNVYLPQRDGLSALSSKATDDGVAAGPDSATLETASFALDVFLLVERCDCFLFDMNGRVPDGASTFRAAAAFRAGKPVVLYKRDHRTKLYGNDNAMITGLSYEFSTVKVTEDLPRKVAEAIGRCQSFETGSRGTPYVSILSELGRDIWEALERSVESESDSPVRLMEEVADICRASEAWRFRS